MNSFYSYFKIELNRLQQKLFAKSKLQLNHGANNFTYHQKHIIIFRSRHTTLLQYASKLIRELNDRAEEATNADECI